MKKLFLSLALVSLLSACTSNTQAPVASPAAQINSSTSPAAVNNQNVVTMQGYAFFPATITIKAGQTVTWKNADNTIHSATADDKSFDTGTFDQSTDKTVTFSKPGTYTYHCSIHPMMKGTIIVK
ncbi:MAG TPA: cupredoxin domain-containing protein [Patescibacteria group bacterium]|nr:cupredoxin domain-containing protein [Patescibacteria group bacterium]